MRINIFGCFAAAMWLTHFVFGVSEYLEFDSTESVVGCFIVTICCTLMGGYWEAWMSDDDNWRNKNRNKKG